MGGHDGAQVGVEARRGAGGARVVPAREQRQREEGSRKRHRCGDVDHATPPRDKNDCDAPMLVSPLSNT